MSTNSSALNLVQRAVLDEQSLIQPEGRDFVLDPPPVAGLNLEAGAAFDTAPAFVRPSRLVDEEIGAGPVVASPVHLNMGRCRADNILTPGSADLGTHNEFRTIKRRLLLALREAPAGQGSPGAILVTSALPGEGKTFTSLNLALTLAMEGDLQVILMEGDVVNPSLSNYFTTAAARKGLTDVLRGDVQRPMDVVHPCAEIENFGIMFAGESYERAPELMAGTRMREIFSGLQAAHSNLVVVVDCSPIISPEPAALATQVNHTIVVVASGQSSRLQLKDALRHVSASPQVSLVFNKSPRWRKSGAYYNYAYGAYGTNGSKSDFGTN